jgi:hypothetical protein
MGACEDQGVFSEVCDFLLIVVVGRGSPRCGGQTQFLTLRKSAAVTNRDAPCTTPQETPQVSTCDD